MWGSYISSYLSLTTSLKIYSQGRDQEGIGTWDEKRRNKGEVSLLICQMGPKTKSG